MPPAGLTADLGVEVARAYGLGSGATLTGPAARGQLGQVWRLATDRGTYAVKEWFGDPVPEEVERAARWEDGFAAGGAPVPRVHRTAGGAALTRVAGVPVRVHDWVEVLPADRGLDPEGVGEALAALHRVRLPVDGPVDPWSTDPVGEPRWRELCAELRAAGAPFAEPLAASVPTLLAAESVLAPVPAVQVCHLDLWADNLRATAGGGLVALDWDNAGPGDPAGELLLVLFEFALGDPARARALVGAYRAAGGPGRMRGRGDATILLAQQGHILEYACRAWLATDPGDTAERARLEAWAREGIDDPVTLETVDALLG